jgi:hypothetical protein
MTVTAINYTAVLVAAVAAWLAGAAWYSLLGGAWAKALGRDMQAFRAERAGARGMARFAPFLLAFVADFVIAASLAGLMWHLKTVSIRGGIVTAVLAWIGFVVTTMSVNNAFAGRRAALTVIDSGHWLVVLLVCGAVIGAFGV